MTQAPAMPGMLTTEGTGTDWTYHCSGDTSQFAVAVESLGATLVAEDALSLDEIFVARIHN